MTVIVVKSGFVPQIYFLEISERRSLLYIFLLSSFFDIPDEEFIYTFFECSRILSISFKHFHVFDRVNIMLSISKITTHGSSYQYESVWGKVFLYIFLLKSLKLCASFLMTWNTQNSSGFNIFFSSICSEWWFTIPKNYL